MSADIAQQLKSVLLAIGREAEIDVDVETDNIIVSYGEFEECLVAPAKSGDAVEFRAALMAFSPGNRDRLFEAALTLNFSGLGGASVALSDRAPVLLLRLSMAADNLHQRELSEALMKYVETTRWVRERLGEASRDQPVPQAIPDIDLVILQG